MKKIIFICIFLLSIFFCKPYRSFADSNFQTSADTTYTVNNSGITHAVMHFQLKNSTPSYYASSYSLSLGFKEISNLYASDGIGTIQPALKKTDNGITVALHFNQKVVGKGDVLRFVISFDTPNVTSHIGDITEVSIPGLTNSNDFSEFNVHVIVPHSFGKPAYIKPLQIGDSLDFTKEQLNKSGISIGFGDKQIYQFNLTYHLANKNIFPVRTEIALPPTTNYQDVYIDNMNPKPSNIVRDQDGNWLAKYSLLPAQKLDVIVTGKAYVQTNPQEQDEQDKILQIYLEEKPYWQVTNSQIKNLAKSLQTPKAIYDYVVRHLTYDISRVSSQQQRVGALGVLNNPSSAVCLEFTDLFITLSRAAGIPAREVDGYAYTQNSKEKPLSFVKDVLHAWPEYYDKESKRWIMVDPTWGNTTGGSDYFNTMDFDHFAFVIRGTNSDYPIPAGGYKLQGEENAKDVLVSFGSDSEDKTPKFTISASTPQTIFWKGEIQGNISFTNLGKGQVSSQMITISADNVLPHSQSIEIPPIPPLGTAVFPFSLKTSGLLTNTTAVITIQIAGSTFIKRVIIYPIFTKNNLILGGILFVSITIIISFIIISTRRLSLSRRK